MNKHERPGRVSDGNLTPAHGLTMRVLAIVKATAPVVVGGFLLAATALTTRMAAQPGDQGGLRPLRSRTSLLGAHTWFQQTYRGVDVIGGRLARHVYDDGRVVTRDHRRPLARDIVVTPSVSASQAAGVAAGPVVRIDLVIQPGDEPRLVWAVFSEPATGTLRTLIDAHTGAVLAIERIARDATGIGRVFDPNPVVALHTIDISDEADADYPALAAAYVTLPLTHLDGSGYLRGAYARIAYDDPSTAFSPTNVFEYSRASTFFSQTMAYHHVTAAQEYLQSLGFAEVRNEPQDLFPDAFGADQSFYSPVTRAIYTGTGGVDDAEDADVILHEYGHAILDDQVPGFGESLDALAIGEGFSDYWAVTVTQPATAGYDLPCLFDWDFVEATRLTGSCYRRVDRDLTIADRTFQEHHDGQIWSRALWDINQALGRDVANTIVIEAQFAYSHATTFDEAARTTIETARRLVGRRAARVVHDAFDRRGLLAQRPPRPGAGHPRQGPPGLREVARLDTAAPNGDLFVFDFEPYGLNDDGTALFAADMLAGGEGIYLATAFDTSEILLSGNPAPGGGVFGRGVLPAPSLNPARHVAMTYLLEPFQRPAGRNAGVYRYAGGTLLPVAVPGVTPAPTGGVFVGAHQMTSISSAGAIAFSGMIGTNAGISGHLGIGVFIASPTGVISTVAAPGDPAPGGGTFDFATEPAMNDVGDIAFGGHVAGRPCLRSIPQTLSIGCVRDLFVRRSSGRIERIVAVGDPAPGGGTFRDVGPPVINVRGDILFRAVLETDGGLEDGYFLSRGGAIVSIARVGDSMPGGGAFVMASFQPGNWALNDRGDVAFSAGLDTFDNVFGDFGLADEGLYLWSEGILSLVARSGDAVPGGQILALAPPDFVFTIAEPFSGAQINSHRQLLFQATVLDDFGRFAGVLYVRE